MTTPNPLPVFQPEGNWAPLAMCVFDVVDHNCIYCGAMNIWDSYEEYVAHFMEFEYEGERDHAPDDEESFNLTNSLCLATASV